MARVDWSRKAASNLQAIHAYIARDSGSTFYAKRFVRGLIQSTRKLERFPHSGRLVLELQIANLREVIHKGYRIGSDDDTIEILTVVHGARDFEQALQEESPP